MSEPVQELEYVRPEDRIYDVATDLNKLDWKHFLYELINREGLNPWDVDLSVLTQTYLKALRESKDVDFDVSGKLLTIAVFLLKTKAEYLVERDIRGIEAKIEAVQDNGVEDYDAELGGLEDLDLALDDLEERKKKKYELKVRNPLARKRKVNIFDLIKTLEKTFAQSNKRRRNFLLKNADVKYDGPLYEKKPKDLKSIIEELFDVICGEFSKTNGHVFFSHLTRNTNHKMDILDKFIPLLHLHNQTRVEIKQNKHFGDITIHKFEGSGLK